MDVGALPISARVHLTHAVVQVLAERAGVDLLHMKGPAFDPALRPRGHSSSDADVLVRPGDVDRLESALAAHGWERFTDFDSGSAFEHAANWFHPNWGYVDVHALWPGPRASPEETYRVLSEHSRPVLIAHCECRAPDRISQILILMLHAARSPNKSDIESAWTEAGDQERAEVRRLADRLAAGSALAVGLGEAPDPADPQSGLWAHYAFGGSRLQEWSARFRAAGTWRQKAGVVRAAMRVNRDHLRMELGHQPSRSEVARRQGVRVRRAVADALDAMLRRRRSR